MILKIKYVFKFGFHEKLKASHYVFQFLSFIGSYFITEPTKLQFLPANLITSTTFKSKPTSRIKPTFSSLSFTISPNYKPTTPHLMYHLIPTPNNLKFKFHLITIKPNSNPK